MKEEDEEHREMLKLLNNEVLNNLHILGNEEGIPLRIEFFFYSYSNDDATNLAIDLGQLGYHVWIRDPDAKANNYCITGWTTPLDLNTDQYVNEWTDRMCKLAELHHSFFDGWGTFPDQSEMDFNF